jgi:putative endonuclease
MPWKILYVEEHETQKEAIKREKYFKSAAGRRWISKNVFGRASSPPD